MPVPQPAPAALTGQLAAANANVERMIGQLAAADANTERMTGEMQQLRGDLLEARRRIADLEGGDSEVRKRLGRIAEATELFAPGVTLVTPWCRLLQTVHAIATTPTPARSILDGLEFGP